MRTESAAQRFRVRWGVPLLVAVIALAMLGVATGSPWPLYAAVAVLVGFVALSYRMADRR